jgi:hypothetical protein
MSPPVVYFLLILQFFRFGFSDQQIQAGDFGVKFEGNSAHIVFFHVSDDNTNGDKNSYKLLFESLEEQDSNGKVPKNHKVATLNGISQWTQTVQTDQYINANLTSTFQIGSQDVDLLVDTYLHWNETVANNGNEQVTIHSNSLKFTIRILNWPFDSTDNTLHFYIKMVTTGKSSASTTETDGTVTSLEVDGTDDTTLYIEFPKTVVADGTNKDMKTLVDTKGTIDLELVFPSATQSLAYDPDVGIKTSNTVTIVLIVVGVVVGVLLIAAVIVGIVWYRRKHRGEARSLLHF